MRGQFHNGKWHLVGSRSPFDGRYGTHWTAACGSLAPVSEWDTERLVDFPDPLCGNCARTTPGRALVEQFREYQEDN